MHGYQICPINGIDGNGTQQGGTPEETSGYPYFSHRQAKEILRFVDDGEMPLLLHCSAGTSRSGTIGEMYVGKEEETLF